METKDKIEMPNVDNGGAPMVAEAGETPQNSDIAPQNAPQNATPYNDDLIDKIESAVEARLQKKLYAGRKQEKIDKKAHKEALKNIDFMDKKPTLLQSVVAFIGLVGLGIAFYGFYLLKRDKNNENNAKKATESANGN